MTISRTFWTKFLSVIFIVLLLLEAIDTRVSKVLHLWLCIMSPPVVLKLIIGGFISFLDRNAILIRRFIGG